jgi:hypothetical protein
MIRRFIVLDPQNKWVSALHEDDSIGNMLRLMSSVTQPKEEQMTAQFFGDDHWLFMPIPYRKSRPTFMLDNLLLSGKIILLGRGQNDTMTDATLGLVDLQTRITWRP